MRRGGSTYIHGSISIFLLLGCPADDTPAETDGASSSGTAAVDTSGDPPATTNPGTTDPTTGPSTATEGLDSTSSGGGEESSSGEPPSDGVCIGLDSAGYIAGVYSLEGAPIDTTCTRAPSPCGGDPVGTWNIEASCGLQSYPNPIEGKCPGSTFDFEFVGQSGSVTLAPDGTFTQDLDIQIQVVLSLDPMACFGADCATFEQFLQMDDPGATCMSMGPTCTCTFPPDPAGAPSMGTYVVMGDQIVLDDGVDVTQLAFCVNGDRLDTWNEEYAFTDTGVLCGDEQDCIDALGDMHELYFCGDPSEG